MLSPESAETTAPEGPVPESPLEVLAYLERHGLAGRE